MDVLYGDVLLRSFHPESACQIDLATAGRTCDENVQAFYDVFAGLQMSSTFLTYFYILQ